MIRTHGDYHLGQTMLTDRGWVILDFEGEPARPLPERRLKRSPLRDVAGMLRSFSYVTAGARLLRGVDVPEEWEERARTAFLEGYFDRVDSGLLPPGEAPTAQLLSVFELEKAVYELRYELNNRPDGSASRWPGSCGCSRATEAAGVSRRALPAGRATTARASTTTSGAVARGTRPAEPPRRRRAAGSYDRARPLQISVSAQ